MEKMKIINEKIITKDCGIGIKDTKISKQKPLVERLFKKAALLAMVSIATVLPFNKAIAAGNTRYIVPQDNSGNYLETTVPYKLPGAIRGSTFIDLYTGNKGYFGKTNLEKTIAGRVGLKSTIVHVNDLFTQVGLGANIVIPTPKWMFAKVGALPVWDNGDKIIANKSTLEYFVKFSLPLGFDLSSFGEWNTAAPGGPKWTYGEISLCKKINSVSISYNPALVANGNEIPRILHRLSIGIDF